MGDCQSVCSGEEKTPSLGQSRMSSLRGSRIEYDGERFILPEEMRFDDQSTYARIDQAARSFCQTHGISSFYVPLLNRIIAYRHVYTFQQVWARLQEGQREEFLEDLNSIEHDLMDSFHHHFLKRLLKEPHPQRPWRVAPPPIMRDTQMREVERQELREAGLRLLQGNRVASVLLCGGASSRFEGGDKFLAPLGLFEKLCILDLVLRRLKRNCKGNPNLPIILGCNQGNLRAIQQFLKQRKFFGFSSSKIRFFVTYSLAALDSRGKYCIDQKMRVITRPSGTASCAEYLLDEDINIFLRSEGVEYIYFSGVENLMENPCDPLLLGLIKREKRQVVAKCVEPGFYSEGLPRFCLSGERVDILGPEEFAGLGSKEVLSQLPVAINSMVFQLASLRQILQDYNKSLFLAQKYRVIAKEEKIYNIRCFREEVRLCYSFEKDLRDIIACVERPLLFKVSRRNNYVPICSRSKQYAFSEAVPHFEREIREELDAIALSQQ